jgi:pimeloyl-ACP methyl ester carboxylesterase
MHCLEAGTSEKPCVLLLHGFPELAYSWRKVMPALADAGYYVIAPDQRGYGETTGWDARYDGDLAAYRSATRHPASRSAHRPHRSPDPPEARALGSPGSENAEIGVRPPN